VYLVEKQRVRASAFDDVMAALADTTHVFEVRAVTPKVALVMRSIPRDQVPTCPIESSPQLLCTWAFP
jgi:hypothetical protein